ncbi:MAG: hypothetical protein D3906_09005, partial [Candidatus Electrothrix sp. AUS1_2]|nr:hypothetical protein [Candidatus Electrothrix sp. AUS1_2]
MTSLGHSPGNEIMPVRLRSPDGDKKAPRPGLLGITGDAGTFSRSRIIKNLRSQTDREAGEETFAAPSPEKNPVHLKRYFFSKKLNAAVTRENPVQAKQVMPSLIGLSLRKGLQQLNRYHIKIQIKGSGRIVEQKPAPG